MRKTEGRGFTLKYKKRGRTNDVIGTYVYVGRYECNNFRADQRKEGENKWPNFEYGTHL